MGPETPMSSCKWQDLFSCSKWYITKNDNFYLTLSALTFNIHFISITLINSAAIDSQNAQLHVNKKIGFTYMVLKQRSRFLVSVYLDRKIPIESSFHAQRLLVDRTF